MTNEHLNQWPTIEEMRSKPNPCGRCGFQPVVRDFQSANVGMLQIYCEQCGHGICYSVDENPVRIWNARNAIKPVSPKPDPVYIYIFEDGEVAQHPEPPTEIDLVSAFQGMLQIIKVDDGKASQYIPGSASNGLSADLVPIPTATVDRDVETGETFHNSVTILKGGDAETGEPYHYHEQERTAF